ncbi:MAG: isocitrate lyase/PEP mutase family protein [Acuticoccus sp.]
MTSFNARRDPHERRALFRAMLAGTSTVVPAPVFDPLSARLAEDAGHTAVLLGGSSASLAVLGAPDITILTLTELAELARRICRVSALPLVVDGDHGYGNSVNVARMVEELEHAGAAAVTIEDTRLPRAHGSRGGELISPEEAHDKLRAAIGARLAADFTIIARTSAELAGGEAALLRRIAAYEAAGVDALLVTGLSTPAALEAVRGATTLPLALARCGPALSDAALLAAHRVRLWIRGHGPMAQAYGALSAAYAALADGDEGAPSPEVAALIARASRETEHLRFANDVLDSEE